MHRVSSFGAKAAPVVPPPHDGCLDPAGAAAFLGVTERHLQALRRRGDGPKYLKPGHRTVRYPIATLREWVAARTVANTSEQRELALKGVLS